MSVTTSSVTKRKSVFGRSLVGSAVKKIIKAEAPPKTGVTPYPLNISSHIGCCGARLIYGFPGATGMEDRVGEFLRGTVINLKGFQLQAILKEAQDKPYGPVLEKHGFKMVNTWKNPNTGNKCFMYVTN